MQVDVEDEYVYSPVHFPASHLPGPPVLHCTQLGSHAVGREQAVLEKSVRNDVELRELSTPYQLCIS